MNGETISGREVRVTDIGFEEDISDSLADFLIDCLTRGDLDGYIARARAEMEAAG